eukprot:Tamp_31401.p1 GENE.Tamp_31401~~Tamp_31401.p1  ORF type:complete len:152 (+),score=45.86 Tamp_31401:242-697(+)
MDGMTDAERAALIANMSPDQRAAYLASLSAEERAAYEAQEKRRRELERKADALAAALAEGADGQGSSFGGLRAAGKFMRGRRAGQHLSGDGKGEGFEEEEEEVDVGMSAGAKAKKQKNQWGAALAMARLGRSHESRAEFDVWSATLETISI